MDDPSGTSGWVDAVAAGGSAAHRSYPILLTHGDSPELAQQSDDWLWNNSFYFSMLIGGPVAINEQQWPPSHGMPYRIAGATRDETAALLGPNFHTQSAPDGYRQLILVNGWAEDGWMYGLAAAGLSADTGAPIALVAGWNVPEATVGIARACDGEHVEHVLVGSESVISADVEAELHRLDGEYSGGKHGFVRGRVTHPCLSVSAGEAGSFLTDDGVPARSARDRPGRGSQAARAVTSGWTRMIVTAPTGTADG